MLVCAACGSTSRDALRIYDPKGLVPTEVTSADVVRDSVQALSTKLSAELTNSGSAKLCTLTRALARRGARLHHVQHFAFAIDGRVVSRPYIDYRAFPNGLCHAPGFEITVKSSAAARRLAHVLRSGS